MGQIANAIGEGADFTFKERSYKVSPCTYEVQGHFERYLESYAIDTYYKLARRLSPEEQDKALAQLHRDITSGRYSFGGQAVREALDSALHLQYMIFLMLKKQNPEVTPELVREMFREQREKLMIAVNLANADPNPQSSEKTEAR